VKVLHIVVEELAVRMFLGVERSLPVLVVPA